MSVQQSINQSILAAGALYSQSGAAEQRKGKLELKKEVKDLKEGRGKLSPEAFEEYRKLKAEKIKDLSYQYGDYKGFEVSRRFTPEGIKREQKKAAEAQETYESAPPQDYDPEADNLYAQGQMDEMEMAAQAEKDRRDKRMMMRQANRAAVKKRIEMLSDRDLRQDVLGGN